MVFEGEICETPDGVGQNVGKTSIYRVQKQEIDSNAKRIRIEADDRARKLEYTEHRCIE